MKKILLFAILIMGQQAYAKQLFQPGQIYATDKDIVSMTDYNRAQYRVSYRISISNPLKAAATLSKGCFVLFNRAGKEIVARGVELNLQQEFAPGESKTGTVYFFSDNETIYTLPFVKWIESNSTENDPMPDIVSGLNIR